MPGISQFICGGSYGTYVTFTSHLVSRVTEAHSRGHDSLPSKSFLSGLYSGPHYGLGDQRHLKKSKLAVFLYIKNANDNVSAGVDIRRHVKLGITSTAQSFVRDFLGNRLILVRLGNIFAIGELLGRFTQGYAL